MRFIIFYVFFYLSYSILQISQQFKILMGNQQGKAQATEQKNQNNLSLSQIPSIQNQSPKKNQKDLARKNSQSNLKKNTKNVNKNQKIQSRGPSALDHYKQINQSKNSNRQSHLSKNYHNTPGYRASPIGSSLSNPKPRNPNQIELYDNYDNQFMPLIKLEPVGQIGLRISLVELVLQKNPKPQLRKKSSVYNSVLTWKKDARNIFTFLLKQDKGYQLVIQVDIQGNTLNNKDQFWSALCPINIPLGKTVKVGQMICVNWYCRMQQQQIGIGDDMGPSLKNVDFKISEEKFVKWGEKVPKSFYDENSIEAVKKVYQKVSQEKFFPYKQLSRYFDSKNIWHGSTFIQQNSQYFRSWIIELTDHTSIETISKQLHADFKNRQNFYIKTIFQRQFGVQKI